MQKKYYFLAGLSRSGSTALGSILSQNPNIYVSGTSGLSTLALDLNKQYSYYFGHLKNSNELQKLNILRSLFEGTYKHIDKTVIFDKGRNWPTNIKLLKEIFNCDPKFIITVRNIPDILASYILIHEKSKSELLPNRLKELNLKDNIKNRCLILWDEYGSQPWQLLNSVYDNYSDIFHIVEYNDLINDSAKEIKNIYDFFELDYYQHDFKNIINNEPEYDDLAYNVKGMHDVHVELKKYSPNAKEVLGDDLYEYYTNLKLEFWRKPQ